MCGDHGEKSADPLQKPWSAAGLPSEFGSAFLPLVLSGGWDEKSHGTMSAECVRSPHGITMVGQYVGRGGGNK